MSPENWLKGVEVLVSLLQSLAWPIAFLVAISYFREPLKGLLTNISELSIKAGGVEASVKRQQIEAAVLLGAASGRQTPQTMSEDPSGAISEVAHGVSEERVREIAHVVSEVVTPTAAPRLREASILWVDDRPTNNTFERRSFEALGITVTTSTSTEDALEKLRQRNYTAVISDMGRLPDPLAGYALLDAVRNLGITTPFFIYAGSSAPAHREETRRRGGQGTTNSPQELFQMVTGAIKGR